MNAVVETAATTRGQAGPKPESAKVTIEDLKGKVDPDWCPGCGDFGVLAALKQAIVERGLLPHQVMTVSGIGCSSNLPGYLNTYGMGRKQHERPPPPLPPSRAPLPLLAASPAPHAGTPLGP